MKKKEPSVSVEVRQDIRKFTVYTYDFYEEIYQKDITAHNAAFTCWSKKVNPEQFLKACEELKTAFGPKRYSYTSAEFTEEIWSNKTGVFKLTNQERGGSSESYTMEFVTSNEELLNKIKEQCKYLTDYVPDVASLVFLVHKNMQGYYLKELGTPVLDFKPENYMPEIVEAYHDIRTRISGPNPFGRLAIIQGPPGTGKTSFIRSLITGNNDAVFIIFPINLLHELDSSAFISFLAEQNAMYEKPVVLILEDADSCLLPRESGNMSFIATLLNSADGIIGSCIDNRIIATTNALFSKIDPAIVRPGRLLRHVEIGKLNKEAATKCLQALSKDDSMVAEGEMTLAEVYEKVYKVSNHRPVPVKKNKIGFGN